MMLAAMIGLRGGREFRGGQVRGPKHDQVLVQGQAKIS